MRHPFRRTLPAPFLWKLLLCGLVLGILFALFPLVFSTPRHSGNSGSSAHTWRLLLPWVLALCIASWYFVLCAWLAVVGAYRAIAFDPFWRPEYFDWLSASPWTADQPLPNGPPYIVWEDILLLATATLAVFLGYSIFVKTEVGIWMHTEGESIWTYCLIPVAYFSITYLGVKFSELLLRLRPAAYLMIAAVLIATIIGTPEAVAVTVLFYFVVSHVGMRILLRRLSANFRNRQDSPLRCIVGDVLYLDQRQADFSKKKTAIAWPHTMLSPVEDKPKIALWEGTVLSLLAGLVIYAICGQVTNDAEFALAIVPALCTVAAGLSRWVVYMFATPAPISLVGRIFTGRWVIPRYDKAFLPCLLVAFLGCMAFFRAFGSPNDEILLADRVWASLIVALSVWLTLNMGPTLARHRLLAPGTRRLFGRRNALTKEI